MPEIPKGLTRREFIKTSAAAASGALLGERLSWAWEVVRRAEAGEGGPLEAYELAKAENILHTVCLQCNTGCPIKVKMLDGLAVKIDGNPYSPWTMAPHVDYKTPLVDLAKVDGAICPKGQAGIQTAYDPYRIRKVLKRAGPRGSGQWVSIDFHQAVDEIVNGGRLFAGVPGEENREVAGLKDLWALRDPKVMDEMAKFVKHEIWHAKTPEDRKQKVAEFKEKFNDHLHALIDPDHPDLGPKNNQFLWVHGRLKAGRAEFFKRFVQDSLGSANFHGHTTVCQGALYFAGYGMSNQFDFDEKDKKAKWTKGSKFYWQGDLGGAEFVIFVGSSPLEANYGPPYRTRKITEGLVDGRLKIAVIDPRLSKTAAKAWKWIPIKPGMEAAFALGMIRWMIENGRYDARFLANANKAAAKEDGEPSWTNASWLVKIDDKGRPGPFLRASDLGLAKEKRIAVIKKKDKEETVEYDFDKFVVLSGGQAVPFDPNDEAAPAQGALLVDAAVGGVRVKSAFQLLKEEAQKRTLAGWAEVCGVKPQDIEDLAREFTAHGKRACADIHRGVSQHTNGFYNTLAWYAVNMLIGNFDWQGGLAKATTYDSLGEKAKGPFNFKNEMHPGPLKPFGISSIRHGVKYEETTLFKGYPARRPWFYHCSDVYQEILPSAGDAYPYPVKALLLYMGTPGYALPAGQTNLAILRDTEKMPLFVASDITIGETSMYADYVIPDLSYLERWEFQGSHPSVLWKVQPVRQPVIAPIPETVKVFAEEMPICLESFMLAVAEKMKLPGFGTNGFGPGLDFKRPEDFYLKMTANLAFGEEKDGGKAVPDASPEEMALFERSRRHLPPSVFDARQWERAVGPYWKKVVYVLNRGGRFQNFGEAFEGEQLKNRYGKQINLYQEKLSTSKNSMTGKAFPGLPTFLPIVDCLGRPLAEAKEDDLRLITYREISQTKSRTVSNTWLQGLLPENFILLNAQDASRLGFKTGDLARMVSDSNPEGVWDLGPAGRKPMVGKVKVIQGIRPGVTAFCLGFGHWAYGARDFWIDGRRVRGDPRRETGVHANAAMALDPYLQNTCLEDLVGGSVSFYDSLVRLVKA